MVHTDKIYPPNKSITKGNKHNNLVFIILLLLSVNQCGMNYMSLSTIMKEELKLNNKETLFYSTVFSTEICKVHKFTLNYKAYTKLDVLMTVKLISCTLVTDYNILEKYISYIFKVEGE